MKKQRGHVRGALAVFALLAISAFVVSSATSKHAQRALYPAYAAGAPDGSLAKSGARTKASLWSGVGEVGVQSHRSVRGPDVVYTFRDTNLTGGSGPSSGEPSLVVDKSGTSPRKNSVYVTTLDDPDIWHSYDAGASWSAPVAFNQNLADPNCEPLNLFGDEDVLVLPNGNVVVADLTVTDNIIQVSTDGAKSFGACAKTAPESDRPWLGNNGNNFVYMAYHDFVAEAMVVCSSIDGGVHWPLCNQASSNSQVGQCAENTVPARPLVVDPVDGSLHSLYSCSTAAENAQHPPYGPLHDYYVANSIGPLVMGQPATYLAAPVFIADTSGMKAPNYGGIFSTMRADSAGNYYAMWVGTADDNKILANPFHVYLSVSTDKGVTWSPKVQVDNDPPNAFDIDGGKGTHVFVDFMATTPGNLDIVWLAAPATGEPNGICGSTGMTHNCMDGTANVGMQPGGDVPGNWNVYMAQTTNALSPNRTFTIVPVTTDVMHTGEVCTNGIVCGNSDRSLLDYISVDVDCRGNAHIAYTRNARNGTPGAQTIQEVDQLSGPTIQIPPTCGPTAVKLSSFTAKREHGKAVVRWRTGSELGALGFFLYRETNGRRVKLSKHLIYSGVTGSARGHAYVWRGKPERNARYWLQEVLPNGKRVTHGPVAVS